MTFAPPKKAGQSAVNDQDQTQQDSREPLEQLPDHRQSPIARLEFSIVILIVMSFIDYAPGRRAGKSTRRNGRFLKPEPYQHLPDLGLERECAESGKLTQSKHWTCDSRSAQVFLIKKCIRYFFLFEFQNPERR